MIVSPKTRCDFYLWTKLGGTSKLVARPLGILISFGKKIRLLDNSSSNNFERKKKKKKREYTAKSQNEHDIRTTFRSNFGSYVPPPSSLSASRSIYRGFPGWYVDERAPARTYAFYEDNKN